METPSQQDRVMKICTDAGFLKTDEVGQCFMTKHTDEFSQFTEEMKVYLNQKVGFEGKLRLGPYWNSQPAVCKVKKVWKLELNL